MEINFIQIILLSLLAFFAIYDELSAQLIGTKPVIVGTITGIIMGDMQTGLLVGGTLQLLVLGVGALGGSSVPDYTTGAIIGTVFAITTGRGLDVAIGLAVPVGLLMIQLDVFARFVNVFFQRRIDKAIDRMDIRAIQRNVILGVLPWGLSRAIPVFIMLSLGSSFIENIINNIPDVVVGGLRVAGGILPAVGLAILTRFLPVHKFLPALLLGFVLTAYLKVPILGVALFGTAIAIAYFQFKIASSSHQGNTASVLVNNIMEEGEYED